MVMVEEGPFDMAEGCSDTDAYPCLWQVNSPVQRTMEALPESHGVLRPGGEAKLQQLLARNSRAHYNVNMRFNASSAIAIFTERPSIGVRSLSNVAFNNPRYEYPFMLWSNSTLGLLCHWIHAGKQQPGRGVLGLTTLGTLPTLGRNRVNRSTACRGGGYLQCPQARKVTALQRVLPCETEKARSDTGRA